MSLFSGILQSQAPVKQNAASAIQTLCLRLTSSSLVEDRRAAIQSLRSFARDYREAVASGGLRGLIGTLARDLEDVDTVKLVLETLLLLFVNDAANPDTSDDISLWLADEFTQKQENLTILFDLLENPEFYTRLYTLQLLVSIQSNRPERTQECVFTAPLGVARLVALLDDKRDAIRNEAILLLVHLTEGHPDLQKLVVFENSFERVFSVIEIEGGVDGGIVAQDCLQLLKNLLKLNGSNQTLFRESGFIRRLSTLFTFQGEGPLYTKDQRDKNIIMALNVCRACLVPGGPKTSANQQAFFNSGVLTHVLNLSFSAPSDYIVRSEALKTCADIIHGNAPLQESFAQLQVHYLDPEATKEQQQAQQNDEDKIYVIEGLLEVALLSSAIQTFDVRIAACSCLESYFSKNGLIKLHFLHRAVDGYTSGEDEAVNILDCLMHLTNESRSDPYRIWIASVIFIHLIFDNDEAKDLASSIALGDEEAGEEVVTAIQTIAGNLVTSLQHNYDPRTSLAYLMVLCTWLYEDTAAVDDFLNEGATVQSLVAAIIQNSSTNVLVQGLCAFLLGILYEFSTKDSSIPRATLHTILLSRLGRDQYINRLTRLRENPIVRDFEVTPQTHTGKRGLPEVFFNHIFIDFLKDNYGRIFRTIDKDPGMRTHFKISSDGTPNGISLEMVDSLKAQLENKDQVLAKLETERLVLDKRLTQEQADFKKFKETAAAEMAKQHDTTENMKRAYENSISLTEKQTKATMLQLENRLERLRQESEDKIQKLTAQVEKAKKEGEDALRKARSQTEMEMKRAMETEAKKLESELRKLDDTWRREMKRVMNEGEDSVRKINEDSRSEIQRTIAEAAAEMQKLHDIHTGEIAKMEESLSLEALRINKSHAEQIKQLRESHLSELLRLQEQLASEKNDLVVRIHELENQVEALQLAKERASTELASIQNEVGSLTMRNHELEAEIEGLKEAKKSAKADFEALQASQATSKSEGNIKDEKIKELELKLSDLSVKDGKIEELQTKLAELPAKDERIRELQSKLKELDSKERDDQKDVEKEEMRKKIKESESKLKELESKDEKIAILEDKVKATQGELDDLLLVLGDLEEKKKEMQKKLRELGQDVSEDEDGDDGDEDEEDDGDDEDE